MPRIAVIGGGAAGLCCADKLAFHSGYSVTVFEQNERIGKKLLSTGNGRCNMTNRLAAPSDYSAPDFVAPAMKRYPPEKVCDFFASLSLFTHTDSEGRVYPLSNQASGVLDALKECENTADGAYQAAYVFGMRYEVSGLSNAQSAGSAAMAMFNYEP